MREVGVSIPVKAQSAGGNHLPLQPIRLAGPVSSAQPFTANPEDGAS